MHCTAPSGCLQYHREQSGVVRSLNYGSTANSLANAVGVEGSRQLANTRYGICVRQWPNQCSITWAPLSSDIYSFTVTGDVGAVDPALLGTVALQQQTCTTDFVVIPNPVQGGVALPSDRFCGLGLATTTSKSTIRRKRREQYTRARAVVSGSSLKCMFFSYFFVTKNNRQFESIRHLHRDEWR